MTETLNRTDQELEQQIRSGVPFSRAIRLALIARHDAESTRLIDLHYDQFDEF